MAILAGLQSYVEEALTQFDQLPEQRKEILIALAEYVDFAMRNEREPNLLFICTHNSRRSHLGQIWARTAAVWYGFPQICTFSGGTEATAFNPRAVAALERAGFEFEKPGKGTNPQYAVRFDTAFDPIVAFSKVFDQPPNPTSDFCAVMTCSQAAEACPVVPGASVRINLPYDDPKDFDGTPQETFAYDERCRQICIEMFYALSLVGRG